jgi:hypothetical protein
MGSASAPLTSSAKGRIIQITLPAQGYLNPLESYLRFDLILGTNGGSNITAVAPRILNSVHCMFRRLRVLYGSLVLEDIQLYNALVRTLTNVAVEKNYQDGVGGILEGMGSDAVRGMLFNGVVRGPATGGTGTSGVIGYDSSLASSDPTGALAPATAADFQISMPNRPNVLQSTVITTDGFTKHTFCIQLASGLLSQHKLIPLKWLANQLTFELELEEPSMFLVTGFTANGICVADSGLSVATAALSEDSVPAEYTGGSSLGTIGKTGWVLNSDSNVSNLAYYLDNIYYCAELLEFDSTYDAAFFQGMASGGVPIKFSSWHTHQHVLAGPNTILVIQERARSVKSAFAIIRNRADQDSTNFLKDPYWTYPGTSTAYASGSVATYWQESSGGIDEFQWRIGGRYFPSQPVKCGNGGAEPLTELQKALNLLGDYSLASQIAEKNWFKPRGTFCIATEFEATNGFEMSGINAEELADLALIIKMQGGGSYRPNAGLAATAAYNFGSFSNATDAGNMYTTTYVNYDALIIIRPNNVVELIQ